MLAVLGRRPPAPGGGLAGLAGDRQGTVCRDRLLAGPIDHPQINSAKNWEAPSAEWWRRHKRGGRSAGGAQIPGEEKMAEGIARRCNQDLISTPMP